MTFEERVRWFRNTVVLAVVVVGLGFASAASAQSVSFSATTKVMASLQMTKTSDLSFGAILSGAVGTATISPVGMRTATGGVTLMSGAPGFTPAGFTLTGDPGASVSVVLPSSPVTLTGGSGTLTVDTFQTDLSFPRTLTVGPNDVGVGATLHVSANAQPATYSGTFTVTAAYN